MHLIYLDESGNTGNNLQETQQPIFVLASLVVPEQKWLPLETELQAAVDRFFPAPRPDDFEIHANEIINPRGFFRQFPVQQRLDFFQAWMAIANGATGLVYFAHEFKPKFVEAGLLADKPIADMVKQTNAEIQLLADPLLDE